MSPDSIAPDVAAVFSQENLRLLLLQSIQEVFATMMSLRVDHLSSMPQIKRSDVSQPMVYFPPDADVIVGMIGFLGQASGVIYFYLEERFARRLAGAFVGMTEVQIDSQDVDMVNDVLGELCNIMAGGFRNQLCETGLECRLTIPSIVRGSHFSIEVSADACCFNYPFDVEGNLMIATLIAKLD